LGERGYLSQKQSLPERLIPPKKKPLLNSGHRDFLERRNFWNGRSKLLREGLKFILSLPTTP
jgi:hypothetical protein